MMASTSETNLSCPVCRDIYKEPVLLNCGHSFCKACLQQWWAQKTTLECPLCRTRSLQRDPPQNLVLKNLCEEFLSERSKRSSAESAAHCSVHSENLRLFCLDDLQPICVVCVHSETHGNHRVEPIQEAARNYREVLREIQKLEQEKLNHFSDIKRNFDQSAKDIEVQAQETERQITDIFSTLKKLLKDEEHKRINVLRAEKLQKSQTMRRRSEALSRDIASLSARVRTTEEVLQTEDLMFLQSYKTVIQNGQSPLPDDPQPIPGGLIDMNKHLNNLHCKVLDIVKKEVTSPPTRNTIYHPEQEQVIKTTKKGIHFRLV